MPSEIIDRYDSEIARRAQARAEEAPDERHPAPGPTVFPGGEGKVSGTSAGAGRFAKLRPQPTHPAQAADREGAAALRLRLFDDLIPEFDDVERAPLVHRSAVNALNVAVMAFSLPVGAVLLTMAVLGRESMTFSARLAAVTGVGIGASQSDAAIQAIQSLLS
ncbi:MAG: hypothetical protein D6801_03370 [Alphaproteobacteria bacterium]|nr:MAG: hypothetical protein D6801_03370 [Alphaproteobacteria bacterium]